MDFDTLPSTVVDEIDRKRADFEAAWRAGQRPRIEFFLEGTEASYRGALLRAILARELAVRRALGERPEAGEYIARFPDHGETIRGLFNGASGPHPVPPQGDETSSGSDFASTTSFMRGGTIVAPERTLEPVRDGSTGVPEYAVPARIGRYGSIRLVGQGGYGRVYYAQDTELGRAVAIKVPHASLLASPDKVQLFLTEARMAAGLKHPAIVTVHDVGRDERVGPFIVMEYIEGRSLEGLYRERRPPPDRLAALLACVADAIDHAHAAGLVHRDLKPGNIMIDAAGGPHVTDFGMAVTEDLQRLRSGEIAGTPQYMAPEQVRGETHRLDGRTDLWGLGVILYFGLTGRLPFSGGSRSEMFDEILQRDPRPPRLTDASVPRELERICLKCLAKRMSERYQSAADLADDLRAWIAADGRPARESLPTAATPATSVPQHRIVPKGLRSFDGADADFFLALLPGPRDRDGLPEPIRFWKARIEADDDDRSFTVGVIYGPSGCGKSSLVRAGLLPRLASRVHPVYVEAVGGETEPRLQTALRRICPGLPDSWSLPDAIAALREGPALFPGHKVLIVLDQFEQWLHAHPEEASAELIRALRQCDGRRVQALVLVRDDFWMSISRFMRALEVRLVEGRNSLAVELFDPTHARKVLAEFGRAWDRLPDRPEGLSSEQSRFLDRAIEELGDGHDGRIIPVRLSLFAEMVRGRPWVFSTLRDVGGAKGIGARFLEETFCGSSAAPEHRLHQGPARAVLKALLPDSSTDLKGAHRSSTALLEVSGYNGRAAEFAVLIGILDSELRLITPTEPLDPDTEPDAGSARALPSAHYQLAHDTLVPSVRQWLAHKQQETRGGRAEIRLAERSGFWNARPEPRQLVSFGEWLQILFWTRRRDWTAPERKMMRAATRRYLTSLGAVGVVVLALVLGAVAVRGHVDEQRKAAHASALIAQLNVADIRNVEKVIALFDDYRRWVDPTLTAIVADPRQTPQMRQLARLALLPTDSRHATAIVDEATFLDAEPGEIAVLCRLLHPYRAALLPGLWIRSQKLSAAGPREHLMRVAGLLADFDPQGAAWPEIARPVIDQLVQKHVLEVRAWTDALRPARRQLVARLGVVFRDLERPATERLIATGVLREYTADDPQNLIELVKDADPGQFFELQTVLERHAGLAVLEMSRELAQPAPAGAPEEEKERRAHRQDNAAVFLLQNGVGEPVWPLLRHTRDPRVRSELVCTLNRRGVDPRPLVARLGVEADISARRALLLALAGYKLEAIPAELRSRLLEDLARSYRDDLDAGIHSAARCVLLRWGSGDRISAIDRELQAEGPRAGRQWYVGREGHTMVVVTPPESSPGRPGRAGVNAPFEVASQEVSLGQFLRFRADHEYSVQFSPRPEYPANIVTWYAAAAYCRWLSERNGVPEDQMCYPPIDQIKDGMMPCPDYLERTGYRLLTEAEWNEACQAGATTDRFFAQSSALTSFYAWTLETSPGHLQPVGALLPNDLGLFDMMGNAHEWCHDGLARDLLPEGDPIAVRPIRSSQRRVLKGGSTNSRAAGLTSAPHDGALPTILFNSVGFRVARSHRSAP
jgi:hypothetical protein